jgi:hypothetical protein
MSCKEAGPASAVPVSHSSRPACTSTALQSTKSSGRSQVSALLLHKFVDFVSRRWACLVAGNSTLVCPGFLMFRNSAPGLSFNHAHLTRSSCFCSAETQWQRMWLPGKWTRSATTSDPVFSDEPIGTKTILNSSRQLGYEFRRFACSGKSKHNFRH